MARHRKKMPAWVLGLVIALVVFTLTVIVLSALGYGDDPVVESLVANSR